MPASIGGVPGATPGAEMFAGPSGGRLAGIGGISCGGEPEVSPEELGRPNVATPGAADWRTGCAVDVIRAWPIASDAAQATPATTMRVRCRLLINGS